MCHGYYDPHALMREMRERLPEPARDPATSPEPVQPAPQGGLVVALARRLAEWLRRPGAVPAE